MARSVTQVTRPLRSEEVTETEVTWELHVHKGPQGQGCFFSSLDEKSERKEKQTMNFL